MPALYSHMPHPFWGALAVFPAIGCAAPLPPLVYLQSLHKPMAVQLHCYFYHRKRSLPVLVSNRVRYFRIETVIFFFTQLFSLQAVNSDLREILLFYTTAILCTELATLKETIKQICNLYGCLLLLMSFLALLF